MKAWLKIVLLAAVVCAIGACKRYSPQGRTGMPKEYTSAWQEIYGRCYDSIPYSVVALDLYSDGLSLDEDHRMQGTGYNLYLSDIIVPDSLLTTGTYRSATTAEPYTFLPGRMFDGTPTGMYMLYIEEGKLQTIHLLDSGRMVVKDTTNGLIDLQFTLYLTNIYGNKAVYETHFQGELQPWQK